MVKNKIPGIITFVIICLMLSASARAGDAPVETEDALRAAIAKDNNDVIAMTRLALIYHDRDDDKEAVRLLARAVKTDPDYPMAHFFLGRLYFRMQKYDDAISELKIFKEKMKGITVAGDKAKRDYINCLSYLSEVYFTLKRYEEAKAEIDEILALDSDNQDAYYNLGVYYYVYEHSRSSSYRAFTKAAEIDPANHVGRNAKYAIEFIRSNPDSRIAPDFSFINKEYRD